MKVASKQLLFIEKLKARNKKKYQQNNNDSNSRKGYQAESGSYDNVRARNEEKEKKKEMKLNQVSLSDNQQ